MGPAIIVIQSDGVEAIDGEIGSPRPVLVASIRAFFTLLIRYPPPRVKLVYVG
jgi:hypothetical protein